MNPLLSWKDVPKCKNFVTCGCRYLRLDHLAHIFSMWVRFCYFTFVRHLKIQKFNVLISILFYIFLKNFITDKINVFVGCFCHFTGESLYILIDTQDSLQNQLHNIILNRFICERTHSRFSIVLWKDKNKQYKHLKIIFFLVILKK